VFVPWSYQAGIDAVRAFESVVFKRVRKLVLPRGIPISGDDWKWKVCFKDMPIRHKLPGDCGWGWMADSIVTVFTMFCVYSRKRLKLICGAVTKLESSFRGILTMARHLREEMGPDHGLILIVDRGYCTRELVTERSFLSAVDVVALACRRDITRVGWLVGRLHSHGAGLSCSWNRGSPCHSPDRGVRS